MRSTAALLALPFALAAAFASTAASAGTVRGSVTLPAESLKTDARDSHWRVENGILAIAPRTPDPRTEVVVVLDGGSTVRKTDDKALAITMDLHGVRLDPKVLVTRVGAVLTLKNSDRVPHVLHFENAPSLLAAEPTPSGQTRTVKLVIPGEYQLRDQEYPHVEGTIVVIDAAYGALVDERGNFRFEAPDGKYTLRVFWRGAWVLTQSIDVGPRTTEIALEVPAPPAPRPASSGRGE